MASIPAPVPSPYPGRQVNLSETASSANVLQKVWAGAPSASIVVAGVSSDGEPLVIEQIDLADFDHPVDALLGFVAPEHWLGIAFLSIGESTAARDRASVGLGYYLSRNGSEAALLLDRERGLVRGRRPEGRIVDALHRAFGLSTAAPPVPARLAPISIWLDATLTRVLDDPGDLSWPAVVALAPFERGDLDWTSPARVGRAVAALATDWGDLRTNFAVGDWGLEVPVGVARWMDDGMFARFALSAFPDFATLLTDLGVLLPKATFRRLVSAVTCALDA